MGDVHPGGNPHYQLDPVALKAVAEHLGERLGLLDHVHAAAWGEGARSFGRKIDDRLPVWMARLKPFAGRGVVPYHNNQVYFLARFGLTAFGFVEPRPGIPPTARHLEELAVRMKAAGVNVVIYNPYYDATVAERLAAAAGGRALLLPEQVGGIPEAKDVWSFFDVLVDRLATALAAGEAKS